MNASLGSLEVRCHHLFEFCVSFIVPVCAPIMWWTGPTAISIDVGWVVTPASIRSPISSSLHTLPLVSLSTVLLILSLKALWLPVNDSLSHSP